MILPVSQLRTQQVTTSQMRWHIQYLLHILLIVYANWWKKPALVAVF